MGKYPGWILGKSQKIAINNAIHVATAAEPTMPKAFLKSIANGIISISLRKLTVESWISINLVKRLAKKTDPIKEIIAHTIAKITKKSKKIEFCCTGSKAGDQKPSPARKTKEATNDANPLKVKQVLSMSLPLSLAPGRKRISPIPNPKSAKTAISANADIIADPKPRASVV